MTRVNYRAVADRFTHIDARFVACEVGLPKNDGFFTVDLYPWWEHPLYQKARTAGEKWGFTNWDEGIRPVTVYPRNVRNVRLSIMEEVTDWAFTQEHPLLWQYERSAKITCNSPVSMDLWMEMMNAVRGKLSGYNRGVELTEYISAETIHRWGAKGSFSLGDFPHSLFIPIRQFLDERQISYFAPYEPEPVQLPVLFLIDGEDYIIANDFEVDVPEFIHKPEWFQAR